MNKCSRCGTILEPDMVFCPECGLPVKDIPIRVEETNPPGGNPNPGRENPQYARQERQGRVPHEEKKVPLKTVGIIGAVCAVALITAVVAVFWQSKSKQDNSLADADQAADQAVQGVKTENTGKISVDIVSMDGDSKKKDKNKEKNSDYVVSVFGDSSTSEPSPMGNKAQAASMGRLRPFPAPVRNPPSRPSLLLEDSWIFSTWEICWEIQELLMGVMCWM